MKKDMDRPISHYREALRRKYGPRRYKILRDGTTMVFPNSQWIPVRLSELRKCRTIYAVEKDSYSPMCVLVGTYRTLRAAKKVASDVDAQYTVPRCTIRKIRNRKERTR